MSNQFPNLSVAITATSLKHLFFYENSSEAVTYAVLLPLLPLLKDVGYKTIVYEPKLFSENIEHEIATFQSKPQISRYFIPDSEKKRIEFLKEAKKIGFTIKASAINKEELIKAIHKFINAYYQADEGLQNIPILKEKLCALSSSLIINIQVFNELLPGIFKPFTKENLLTLTRVCQDFYNQLIAYLGASGSYKNNLDAQAFLDKKTKAMASLAKEEDGCLVICSYRYLCHTDFPVDQILAFHLTYLTTNRHTGFFTQIDSNALTVLRGSPKVTIISSGYAINLLQALRKINPKTIDDWIMTNGEHRVLRSQ